MVFVEIVGFGVVLILVDFVVFIVDVLVFLGGIFGVVINGLLLMLMICEVVFGSVIRGGVLGSGWLLIMCCGFGLIMFL